MKKKKYVSPELTVVSFRTEVGYAASGAEKIDNVAHQISEFTVGFATWDADGQEISGYSTENGKDAFGNDGLAAGYFYQDNTDSWF